MSSAKSDLANAFAQWATGANRGSLQKLPALIGEHLRSGINIRDALAEIDPSHLKVVAERLNFANCHVKAHSELIDDFAKFFFMQQLGGGDHGLHQQSVSTTLPQVRTGGCVCI